MATIMVMYTLRQSADGTLEGPINKKVYQGMFRTFRYG